MKRVVLIHFKPEVAQYRLEQLREAGYEAEYLQPKDFRSFAPVRANPPDVFVIDLSVRPKTAKGIGEALAQYAATREVPQAFMEDDKSWKQITKAIDTAKLPTPPPKGTIAGYSGSPLPKKMGIKPGSKVIAIGAPDTFEETRGALPENAEFVRAGRADLIILFTTTQADLEVRFRKAMGHVDQRTRIAMAWPKKTSGVPSDLNENHIRDFGLGMGWVDFKVFAIDKTWSGLLFAPKKNAGASAPRHAAL
jgi:hypothetical protein